MDEHRLNQLLDKLYSLDAAEKNNLYHFIADTIKKSNPNQAASLIVGEIVNLLANKRDALEEKSQEQQEGKVSPIFRRVS